MAVAAAVVAAAAVRQTMVPGGGAARGEGGNKAGRPRMREGDSVQSWEERGGVHTHTVMMMHVAVEKSL